MRAQKILLVAPDHYATLAILLAMALALDALFGEMPFLTRIVGHPAAWIGRAIAWAEPRLNRVERGDGARRFRGAVLLAVSVLLAGLAGGAIGWLAFEHPFGWLVAGPAMALLFAQRSLNDHVAAVADGLERGGIEAGRRAVSHIVGRDPERLDGAGVARAAIESLSENYSDGVVAPIFWTVLLGPVGLVAYKTVNTLDSMIGHRSPRYRQFGWASARFDDLVNWPAARLSGAFIVAAAWIGGEIAGARFRVEADWRQGWQAMLRDAAKHRSPNAGWPEAAMAGALGLRLAGPRHYAEGAVDDAWMGDGRAEATGADIRRALKVYRVACALSAAAAILVLGIAMGG